MTPQQLEAYNALSLKRAALYVTAQKLAGKITPTNQDELSPTIKRLDLELQLVNAILSEIVADAPVSFPSHETLVELAQLAAQVHAMVVASEAAEELVAAADAVIETWPTF